ncbi:unnamed protein product [Prorocentrum cordatum]|uniref:Carbonic anhydrase n=1 Tax=Prorocentrum cordatum TaxID=2364126 RepID=A0ABN9UZH7_9DINO|nr:unnamed protein product [Polarella glacialis]
MNSAIMSPPVAAALGWLAALGSVPMALGADGPAGYTCGAVKDMYKDAGCCGQPDATFDVANYQIIPAPDTSVITTANPCEGTKPTASGFDNFPCADAIVGAVEQAGANVTEGYMGGMAVDATPWNLTYLEGGLCPVNVHWHYGAEHLSVGQFDEDGTGRNFSEEDDGAEDLTRRLAVARLGFQCHHFDEADPKFTTEYEWAYCVGMHVGETYEVHWPHSAAGACGTPFQYQTPFYDGVFCRGATYLAGELQHKVGVQAQVFVIVNDEDYFYPDLMRGMIMDPLGAQGFGADIAYYTGSTTGTSRDNEMCSAYSPITWQVDRKCHLISASSFDKMCADMLQQKDDMSDDLHAHGARELVSDELAADNLQRL